ncbi:hypothetical protein CFP56_036941 [Quercus suber]|uniref:Uncharacterized protein n=1 Tax=Quercus suber TaxID=58331 RepID=A0AAW0J625_QUESU
MYRFTAEMLMDHLFLNGLSDEELLAVTCVSSRDGNFCLTRGYPAWPDPNGPGFT